MQRETVDVVCAGLQSIETQVRSLETALSTEGLRVNERQYLARCVELLYLELTAVRMYVGTVAID